MSRLSKPFWALAFLFILPATAHPQAGPEFRVNTYTTSAQSEPAIASDGSGNFVVVWESYGQDGLFDGIFGRRFTSAGAPRGAEFRVNTFTASSQDTAAVASTPTGDFVVVWESSFQDGSNSGVFGQRFDRLGVPVGAEFRVNSYTTGYQSGPDVAVGPGGNFVVVWTGPGLRRWSTVSAFGSAATMLPGRRSAATSTSTRTRPTASTRAPWRWT